MVENQNSATPLTAPITPDEGILTTTDQTTTDPVIAITTAETEIEIVTTGINTNPKKIKS